MCACVCVCVVMWGGGLLLSMWLSVFALRLISTKTTRFVHEWKLKWMWKSNNHRYCVSFSPIAMGISVQVRGHFWVQAPSSFNTTVWSSCTTITFPSASGATRGSNCFPVGKSSLMDPRPSIWVTEHTPWVVRVRTKRYKRVLAKLETVKLILIQFTKMEVVRKSPN